MTLAPHSIIGFIGLAGYIILIVSRKPALSYFGVFLAASGIYPNLPNTIAWVSNNVEGSYKRSVSLAMVVSCGSINGAVSSNVVSSLELNGCHMSSSIVFSTGDRTSRGTRSAMASFLCTFASD